MDIKHVVIEAFFVRTTYEMTSDEKGYREMGGDLLGLEQLE